MPRSRRLLLLVAALLLINGSIAAAPTQQTIANVQQFTFAIRADLSIAANEVFGEGVRPENWTDNIDNTSRTYVSDLWFDNELLANEVFGENRRPPQWIGVTVDVADILARNVRHDLEQSADQIFGVEQRPAGWNGADPIFSCPRTVQNILDVAEENFSFSAQTPEDAFGYCTLVEAELRDFLIAERELLPVDEVLDELILAARGDIERLANEVYGVNERPIGWAGNTDINSPLLLTDNYADLGLLTDTVLGANIRPDGWIGLITDSRPETWRNLRHDLELLADVAVPDFPSIEGERPRGWQNDDPLLTCPLPTQDLVISLEVAFIEEGATFDRTTIPDDDDYCANLLAAANNFAEKPPLSDIDLLLAEGGPLIFESEIAFAYLDVSALEYLGAMPLGVEFRAWYRNFNDSTMMFVSGNDFAVFIDRRFTTLPQDVFDRLPTLEGVRPLTFCDADWCNGPGPTPTPTGGAIESLLLFETPEIILSPTPAGGVDAASKTQVNFENVRITYLSDNTETRSAQVTLELCLEIAVPATCEPVISVFNQTEGVARPIVRQQNGLNVYDFPYGYTADVLIESETLVSNDIFVSDPALPR